jgi:hypothetical protein
MEMLANMSSSRVATLIESISVKYGRNFRQVDHCHWRYEVMTEPGRSQVVFLIYKEQTSGDKDVSRLIAESPIGPLHRGFDYEAVLRKNSQLDVGAICINDLRDEDNLVVVPYLTLRATHLAPTADFEEVWELIDKVGCVADQLEKELFVRDLH